ncbi:hypothetical protein [Salinivibrio kushneri]|uniref:Uncharacterized protein n=1 Tax=Salinivibrio kushneri TaxID=1908198 RepID=A0AA47KJC7_9GAMM|nr:hypothetical protein [Salinivibrio kushneri]WBA07944.1 hypothetical protein N8M53_08885 [Salinivibrio kushneri]
MKHKRYSNKKIKEMLNEVMPEMEKHARTTVPCTIRRMIAHLIVAPFLVPTMLKNSGL